MKNEKLTPESKKQLMGLMGELERNLSKKKPGKYSVSSPNGYDEVYLFSEDNVQVKKGFLKNVLEYFPKLEFAINSENALAILAQVKVGNNELKTYLELLEENHNYLQETCEKFCENKGIKTRKQLEKQHTF